ncbi:hypothetical protein B0G76_1720 [Paraburkholderia sp. BL23I1N1]|uniref:hypothetical protein n=1 Tax=Paraburkholderia sp. BL9I2N2 TaxID=1938809 RepID=UPI000A5C0A7A|nr:hypothetical protein [Paraburkholderia sp. BL9I2N2]REE18594.1 hypothetical protein B0G71_1648 [Paraburkholderia sp. BL27I4N3]RKE35608.1 hypothetical protein B0G76_1720 [Paraburkholderia sp. BL23I1N1]TCK94673.1 hypothetical protein B0G74_1264 [Paraburkholderia sp. BL9I2N2]
MDTAFLRLESEALERIALLELIACACVTDRYIATGIQDAEVSCETASRQRTSLTDRLPDGIRRVLGDARSSALARDLLGAGALRVFVDADALQRRCELIERQWRDQDLLRAFVERQASIPMIRRFFRTATRATITQLRAELNVLAPTKPRALSRSGMDQLFDAWARLKDIGDLRERYLALHEQCDGRWSLATLFAALDADAGDRHPSSSHQESDHVRHAT